MIDISYLYCGKESASVAYRYGTKIDVVKESDGPGFEVPSSAQTRRPIVVWNITRTCNLKCIHCYSDSAHERYPGELTTKEALSVIDDLAEYRVPAILFSGGEPLFRRDLFELVPYASSKGLRLVLSTNGTVINHTVAKIIRESGFSYVGVSLDG